MDEPDEPESLQSQDEDGSTMAKEPVRGEEMFRRVLQLYPLANPHDYFKNGRWQIDVMDVDLALLEAHRKEASAPEPTPLDDIVLPDDMPRENGVKRLWTPAVNGIKVLPQNGTATNPRGISAATAAVKPIVPIPIQIKPASSLYRPAVKAKATAVSVSRVPAAKASPYQPRPASEPPKAGIRPAIPRAMSVVMKSTTAELERIDEFIAKHGLVPVLAKIALARLAAPRRHWVLENYDGSTTLDEFIGNSSEPPPLATQTLTPRPKPKATAKATVPGVPLRPLKRSILQSSGSTGTGGMTAASPGTIRSTSYRPLLSPGGLGPRKVPKTWLHTGHGGAWVFDSEHSKQERIKDAHGSMLRMSQHLP